MPPYAPTVRKQLQVNLQSLSGRYFEDCNEADRAVPGIMGGIAPYALDPVAATRLWELSLRELKLQ
jgi:hypothetical protein